MQLGKQLVIAGFLIALFGMLLHVASFSADANEQLGSAAQANTRWPIILGTVGSGTLLWLVGAIVHVVGGLDSEPNGPDLYF